MKRYQRDIEDLHNQHETELQVVQSDFFRSKDEEIHKIREEMNLSLESALASERSKLQSSGRKKSEKP